MYLRMRGINRSKHSHLISALAQLQGLLRGDPAMQEITVYLEELEKMYKNYEQNLTELSVLIAEYEDMHNEVKVQYLGKKLKELRKGIPADNPDFVMLIENIRLGYGA